MNLPKPLLLITSSPCSKDLVVSSCQLNINWHSRSTTICPRPYLFHQPPMEFSKNKQTNKTKTKPKNLCIHFKYILSFLLSMVLLKLFFVFVEHLSYPHLTINFLSFRMQSTWHLLIYKLWSHICHV